MSLIERIRKIGIFSLFWSFLLFGCKDKSSFGEQILQERIATFALALGIPEHIDPENIPVSEYIPLSSSRGYIGEPTTTRFGDSGIYFGVKSLNCIMKARLVHGSWAGEFTSDSEEYPWGLEGKIETPEGIFIVKRLSENQIDIDRLVDADTLDYGSLIFSVSNNPLVGSPNDYWEETNRYINTEFFSFEENTKKFSITVGVLNGGMLNPTDYSFSVESTNKHIFELSYLFGNLSIVPRREHDCNEWLREVNPEILNFKY